MHVFSERPASLEGEIVALRKELAVFSAIEAAYGPRPPDLRGWVDARTPAFELDDELVSATPSLVEVSAHRAAAVRDVRVTLARALAAEAEEEADALLRLHDGAIDRVVRDWMEQSRDVRAPSAREGFAVVVVDRRSPSLPEALLEDDRVLIVGRRSAVAALVRPASTLVADAVAVLDESDAYPVVVLTFARALLCMRRFEHVRRAARA